jgi:hypothetical protein
MVAVFVHDKSSRDQWRIIFLITAVALITVGFEKNINYQKRLQL